MRVETTLIIYTLAYMHLIDAVKDKQNNLIKFVTFIYCQTCFRSNIFIAIQLFLSGYEAEQIFQLYFDLFFISGDKRCICQSFFFVNFCFTFETIIRNSAIYIDFFLISFNFNAILMIPLVFI